MLSKLSKTKWYLVTAKERLRYGLGELIFTFAANVFTSGCAGLCPPTFPLHLTTVPSAADHGCLNISSVEPIKSSFHLPPDHCVGVKHKLIALSWVGEKVKAEKNYNCLDEMDRSSSSRQSCCSPGSSRNFLSHREVRCCKCLPRSMDLPR